MHRFSAYTSRDSDSGFKYKVSKVNYSVPFTAELVTRSGGSISLDNEKSLNRAMLGDIVSLDENNMVCDIIEKHNPQIVGIIQARSVVTYGVSKKGTPLYLVKTLNPNYPNFLVPYDKRKRGTQNQYVVIRRHTWASTSKKPTGRIESYIGKVGDMSAEIGAILTRFDLPSQPVSKNVIRSTIPGRVHDTGVRIATEVSGITTDDTVRLDLRDRYVFSIDPVGCEDIDDAMHLQDNGDGSYEIGIHIADPAAFLPPGSKHDAVARQRASSVYAPDPVGRIDMLHPSISTQSASLLAGEDRRTNSVLFTVSGNEIREVQFVKSIIQNRQNLCYDDIGTEMVSNLDMQSLFSITTELAKRYLPKLAKDTLDSHKLVEIWMVLTNHEVGKELVKRFGSGAPIRTFHLPSRSTENGEKDARGDQSQLTPALQQMLRIRNYSAANYVLPTDGSNDHAALGICNYTHFTSPIRRYLDMVVHRMLFYDILDPDLPALLNHINMRNRNIKRAERRFNLLRIVQELTETGPMEEEMILVDWSGTSMELWSERWRCVLKYRLVPRLLEQRYSIISNGNVMCNDGSVVHHLKRWSVMKVRCVQTATAESLWQKVQFQLLDPKIELVSDQ